MKGLRVTIDGETFEVDSVEEANDLLNEHGGDEDEIVPIHVRRSGGEWVATVADSNLDYEGRANRKWGAIRELVELVDERAERFGF